jgi:hypothetical protein
MKKEDFIHYTIETWQPYYEEELTEQDAIEIIDNFTAFMKLLIKWDREKKERREKNGKKV